MGLYIACVRTWFSPWPIHTTPNKKTIIQFLVGHSSEVNKMSTFITVRRKLTCNGCKSGCRHGLDWHASHPAFVEWGEWSQELRDLATSRSGAASQFDCTEKQLATGSRDVRRLAARSLIQQERFCLEPLCSNKQQVRWLSFAGWQGITTRDFQTVIREDLHWKKSPVKSLTNNRLCFPQNPVTEEKTTTAFLFQQVTQNKVVCNTSNQRVHCYYGPSLKPISSGSVVARRH